MITFRFSLKYLTLSSNYKLVYGILVDFYINYFKNHIYLNFLLVFYDANSLLINSIYFFFTLILQRN